MSPLLKSVEKAGIIGLRRKRNPSLISTNDFFVQTELLRAEFARLLNVKDSTRIAIIPSVSYGIATVAANIRVENTQNVIVAGEEFPSNYYAWKSICAQQNGQLKVISPPENFTTRGEQWNIKIRDAIDTNTKVVALGHVHWTDGTRFDLEAIRKRTKDVGALLIIDGTQSVGALPFDVDKIQPDAVVCAGYKWLLGPYSIGVAYFGNHFNDGKPVEENWISRLNSSDFSKLAQYENNYQPGALRYDVGERSNFILVPMLLSALKQLNKWGVANIQSYCSQISSDAISRLKENGFWIEDEAFRSSHLFGIRLPHPAPIDELKDFLLKKNLYVSFRGDAIRVSPNVYNDKHDLEKLASILIRFSKNA